MIINGENYSMPVHKNTRGDYLFIVNKHLSPSYNHWTVYEKIINHTLPNDSYFNIITLNQNQPPTFMFNGRNRLIPKTTV